MGVTAGMNLHNEAAGHHGDGSVCVWRGARQLPAGIGTIQGYLPTYLPVCLLPACHLYPLTHLPVHLSVEQCGPVWV